MSFQGVVINKKNTGRIDPVGDFDRTGLLMLVMPDLTGINMEYGKSYRLIQKSDADDLGLLASYDSVNNVLVYYHIEEFFRIAPDGILHIVPVEKNTLANIAASAVNIERFHCKVMGFSDYTLDETLEKDVQTAQSIINGFRQSMIYISSCLIGSSDKVQNLRTFASENVSVVIAKDPLANNIVVDNKLAAIGAAMGGLCVRQVSENLGSVNINNKPDGFIGTRDYPLTDLLTGKFVGAVLTDNTDVSLLNPTATADLTARGYIFASSYIGYPGVFFNSSPTCTIAGSNYAYIERNATWDKAAILVRDALMPQIKSKLPKSSGKIIPTKIQELKNIASGSLKSMVNAGELDGVEIVIDANQTVSESIPLDISIKVSVGDILHEIKIALAVTNQI